MSNTSESRPLSEAASYFPLQAGVYDVGPGLKDFGTDLGNETADQQVFQIDENFLTCRQVKLDARQERLSKYYRTQMLSSDVSTSILRFIIERLTLEHPGLFQLSSQSENDIALHCKLTNETLVFDQKLRLTQVVRQIPAPSPDYHDSRMPWPARYRKTWQLSVSLLLGVTGWQQFIFVRLNNWAAEEKIGQSFQTTHDPVAGMKNSQRDAENIVNTIVNKGPFLRFAWG